MAGKTDQTFSFEVVACLLAAMAAESNTTVGNKHYALMAKIDGAKTSSGYEHMFRAAKNKAREINEKISKGELDIGVTPLKSGTPSSKGKGGSKKATPASTGKKRGRKTRSDASDGDEDESPSKKVKAEKKEDEDDDEGEYV